MATTIWYTKQDILKESWQQLGERKKFSIESWHEVRRTEKSRENNWERKKIETKVEKIVAIKIKRRKKKCREKDEINTQRRRRKVEKSKIGRKICMTVIGLRKSAGVTVIWAIGMPVSPRHGPQGAYDLLLVPRSLVEETKAEITCGPGVLHYRN